MLDCRYEHVNVLVDILEGKKRAANAERAVAAAEQAKKDAELAEIKAKRDAEVAKIRAAAEAAPTSAKVTSSLNWQEELQRQKEERKIASEKKKKEEEEEAKRAAEAAANVPKEAPKSTEEGERKQSFAAARGMFK